MTQEELASAVQSGAAKIEEPAASAPAQDSSPAAQPNPGNTQEPTSINQFLPVLFNLQSTTKYLSAAPTTAPQTFQDQIQFVFDGTNYWLYFYAKNQWNGIIVAANDYGDGSDGDVTIGANTTLTRDMFYNSLTITAGFTLFPNGFKVFSKNPIVNNGTISLKGGNGGNGGTGVSANAAGAFGGGGTAGTAGAGIPTGSIKQPGDGKLGGIGVAGRSATPINGVNGGNETNSLLANNAANGGNSGTGAINVATGFSSNAGTGGVGGTATQTTKPSARSIVFAMRNAAGDLGCNPTPGSGAGGGGGLGTSPGTDADGGGGGGGGSGAPGGIAWLCAPKITVSASGVIAANGGDGGKGGDGGSVSGPNNNYAGGGGGGGAPGNGGLIVLITPIYTNLGSVTVAAGTPGGGGVKGAGSNAGNAPTDGSTAAAGHAGAVVQIIP